MKSPKYSKTDPAVLLLDDIEILLAQTRLMELHLKRAQAVADDKMARLQEQFQEELIALRSALTAREQALAAQQGAVIAEQNLRERVQLLESQLGEERRELQDRNSEIQGAQANIAGLLNRIGQLDAAHEQAQATVKKALLERQDLEGQLSAVRRHLEDAQQNFQRAEIAANGLKQGLQGRISELQDRLWQSESRAQRTTTEIQQAGNEINALRNRLAELEASRQEAEQRAALELQQARGSFDAEIAALRSSLEKRDHALRDQQFAALETERHLKGDILRAQEELEQQRMLLASREEELCAGYAQIAALEQRATGLEAASHSIIANAEQLEKLRRSHEEEIAGLRNQVVAHERALAERQEAVTAIESALQKKSESLDGDLQRSRHDVEELRSALQARDRDLHAHQSAALEVERKLKDDLLKSRDELERQRALLSGRDEALRAAEDQVAALQDRATELASAHQSVSANAQQLDNLRRTHEEEIAALRHQVTVQERSLTEGQEAVTAVELTLHSKIQSLNQDLARARHEVDERDTAIGSTRAEQEALRARIAELEADAAQADARGRELADKENEIAVLRATSAEQQASDERRQQTHKSNVDQLNVELEHQRHTAQQANAELDGLRAAIAVLDRQKIESEMARRQLEDGQRQAIDLSKELEARLQAKDEDLQALRSEFEAQQQSMRAEQARNLESLEEQLNGEIQEFRNRWEGEKTASEQAQIQIAELRAVGADFEQQKTRAEMAGQEIQEQLRQAKIYAAELSARLETKDQELGALQSQFDEHRESAQAENQRIVNTLEEHLTNIRHQLEGAQKTSEQARSEGERLRAMVAVFEQQEAQAEMIRQQVDQTLGQANLRAAELSASIEAKDEELRILRSRSDEQLEAAQAERERNFNALEQQLKSEIDGIRDQLNAEKKLTEEARDEIDRLSAAAAALEAYKREAEAGRSQLEESQQQANDACRKLEIRLQAKDEELRTLTARVDEQREFERAEQEQNLQAVKEQLNGEIDRLRTQLDNDRRARQEAGGEIVQLRTDIAALEQRNSESERSRRDLEQTWEGSETQRQQLQAHLDVIQGELSAARANARQDEDKRNATIEQLHRQLAERQLVVESRAAEIVSLQAAVDQLSTQLTRRDSIAAQTQAALLNEAETIRSAHQARISALEEEHRSERRALETELTTERQTVINLRRQIAEIQEQKRQAELRLNNREQEAKAAAEEAANWRTRLDQLENLHENERAAKQNTDQTQKALEADLTAVRNELQQKSWALAQQQATLDNLALTHRAQLDKFESRIEEKQRGMKDREAELENRRSQTESLQRRVEELQRELAALNQNRQLAEQYALTIDELNKQLTHSAEEITQHEAEARIAHSLREEIQRQIREAEEKTQILQDRNDELVRVKSEMDQLHDRLNQLQSARSQTESALTAEAERVRTEFQARVAFLQAELSQKEWALEDRQATGQGVEQSLRQEIESLRHQLVESESVKQKDTRDFVLGEPQSNHLHGKHFQVAENGETIERESSRSGRSRRWNTGFGWKRRWR